MANLLRTGYTMLNLACPHCNNPIFRSKTGNLFCPICNKQIKIIRNNNEKSFPNLKNTGQNLNNNKEIEKIKVDSLKNILYEKISYITQKLEKETQLNIIEDYINLLVKIYDLLEKILKF
ncbi:MAG: Sjogren's syndrome/scleroderma autoantigen 1 family protein [Promethearchaeota archaeon]